MLKKIIFLIMTLSLMFAHGATTACSIGDRVWLDSNRNGLQDNGETGLGNLTVKLLKDGSLLSSKISNTDGSYKFCDLKSSDNYQLSLDVPSGYSLTTMDTGDDDSDSDINPLTKMSALFSLVDASSKWDIGLYQGLSSLRGHVWIDSNKNGVDEDGEVGAKGVTVILYKNSDPTTPLKSKQTDENGNYTFCNLDAGDYFVKFSDIPTGNKITQKDQGESDWADSDADPLSGKTDIISLKPDEVNDYTDMGYYDDGSIPQNKASLGDRVWLDLNENGTQDIGESGISGIKVTLYDANNKPIGTTTTDTNGQYLFENLTPADYYVIFTLPAQYKVSPQNKGDDDKVDSDADESGKSDMVKLVAETLNSTLDIGLYKNGATIGDKVWFDVNDNGILESDESGVQDITVTLYDANTNKIVGTATKTNATGDYHFTGVAAGNYYIIFSGLSDKQMFTGKNKVDANGKSESFSVSNGENKDTIDAPIKEAGVLSARDDIGRGESTKSVKVDVLANDTAGKYPLLPTSVKIVGGSDNGKKLIVANEGTWNVDSTTGTITFTPNTGFLSNPTRISYSVEDTQKNGVSAQVTVLYPPVAVDDVRNAQEGNKTTIYVLDNDKISSVPFDKTTLKIIDPQNKTEVDSLTVSEGVWKVEMINNEAVITFTPSSGSLIAPQPIEYVISDLNADKSNNAKVTINYYNIADDIHEVKKGINAPYIIDVRKNDKGIGTDIKIGKTCADATQKELKVSGEGTWKVNEDGTVTFTPEAGFTKNPTDIFYNGNLTDSNRSNCAIIDIRHIPLANDDSALMSSSGTTTIAILINDVGDFNASSVKLIKSSNGTLSADGKTLTVPNEGEWKVDESGNLTFSPKSGFTGIPTPIKYTFTDKKGTLSNEATVTLTQSSTGTLKANNDEGIANGNKPIIIEVLKNDTGDIDKSTVLFIDNNTNTPVKTLSVKDEGTWSVDNNGIVTFTPVSGYEGTPTAVGYVVSDKAGNRSNIATISIKGSCSCEDYTSSIALFDNNLWFILMTLTTLFVAFVATRREEKF